MADLVGTVDPLAEGDDDASDEDAAPRMTTRRGGFKFKFEDSGSEDDIAGGWDFEGGHAVEASSLLDYSTGLEAKIRARLKERGELPEDEDEEEPKKKKKKKASTVDTEASTSAHLKTGIHFSELRISRPLLRALADLKFESPTPIQRDVIPPALAGHDILATAETGSGKTASFLLPMLERLCQSANVRSRKRDANGHIITGRAATKALVLLPTRELAVQCHAMLRDVAKYAPVTFQLVAGGFVSQDQANSLRQQPDLVIATPGRMLDHLLNTQCVHMELLEIVVFDEADRLLEMGFKEECQQVLKCCSNGRQTMLFSATTNASVDELAKLALNKPVRIKASAVNRVVETLEQEFVKSPSEDLREAVLMSLVTRSYKTSTIIFCATKKSAHRLAIIFGFHGLKCSELHGNLPQGERVAGLKRFQKAEVDFLLATDLAARGLDLDNVKAVINFQIPVEASRYIHRVGRTARMGRLGHAVTIYAPEEYAKVKNLGKLCCNTVKSKVLKRTVAADSVEEWAQKIANISDDIKMIIEDEGIERELRLAETLSGKAEILNKHKASIKARPAKEWYMTNIDKEKAKAADKERLMALGGQQTRDQHQREPSPDPEAKAEEKRKKRFRDKHAERKQKEKQERAQMDARIRKSAKRVKKDQKQTKGDDGARKITKQEKTRQKRKAIRKEVRKKKNQSK